MDNVILVFTAAGIETTSEGREAEGVYFETTGDIVRWIKASTHFFLSKHARAHTRIL